MRKLAKTLNVSYHSPHIINIVNRDNFSEGIQTIHMKLELLMGKKIDRF